MDFTEITIGTKLELEIFDEDGVRLGVQLISEFEWMVNENTALIAAPIHEGVLYPLRIGTVTNVYFSIKKYNNVYLYRTRARILARTNDGNLALLKVRFEGSPERIQRRGYFRLDCSVPVRFRVVDSFNETRNEGIPYMSSITSNLSGGGMNLLLIDKIDDGSIIECELQTDRDRVVRFFGKVIKCGRNPVETKLKFQASIVFAKITDKDREEVIKYIFKEQRILRKKGLI